MNEGSKFSSNPSPTALSDLSVLNEVACFDTIEFSSCSSDLQCMNNLHDYLAMHVPQLVKQNDYEGRIRGIAKTFE